MNYGRTIGLVMAGECVAASVAYGLAHDWRRAIYWMFAAGINFVLVY